MSQYDQLTVVKLREELSKRELPKVGLKATLIRRLLDDDWRSGVPEEEPLEDLDQQDATQPSSEPDLESQSGSEASDESTPEDLYPAYVRNQLRYCLSNVRYAGSFTASRTCQRIVNPGIRVNDIGDITSPLTVQDAKAILKVGAQSPFGRGSATIIDKSFRNTVELNPDQFKLCNPAWSQEINRIVALLGEDLGFSDSPSGIRPNLYKMLLYEKDAMFKAHKE